MEKYTTAPNIADYITKYDFENFFNVATNTITGLSFQNINKSIYIKTDNLPPKYYSLYTTKGGEHWPIIAYNLLGNVKLWWLLCKFNNVMDPTKSLEPGIIIKIPSNEIVGMILSTIEAKK